MSGIAGVVCHGGVPDADLLGRMATFLEFRGPDGSAVWSKGAAGFCHAALVTDVARRQNSHPFASNGQASVVADARLDSRKELVASLRVCDPAASETDSDAELILRAWEAWGENCVEHLYGDFAFALWDSAAQHLWCVRDRFGIKPFFYANTSDTFIFSNTLDCVRLHPEVSDCLDERAIGDFLLTGWNPNPAITSFRDIARLPAAHALHLERGTAKIGRYWSLPAEELIRYKNPQDYLEEFKTLLEQAVGDRLPSDSAGFLLSGGLDSTSIAAMGRKVCEPEKRSCDLRAYTIDYRPLFADQEPKYASQVASALGIPLQLIPAAPYLPYARWQEAMPGPPEPLHDPFLAFARDHLRTAGEHSRVLLGGEGGDVLLLGQTWPYLVKLCRGFNFVTVAGELGSYLLTKRRVPPLLSGYPARVKRWLGRRNEFAQYPIWINEELESRLNLRARWGELQQEDEPNAAIRPRAFANLKRSYWTSLSEAADPGATGIPVETREPLFDLRVVRFLLRLPPLPWCVDKQLIRRAMRGMLPEAILQRPKTLLAADPLVEYVRQNRWNPLSMFALARDVERFVAPKRLRHAIETQSAADLWTNLRPYSLNYWLQTNRGSSIKLGRENRENLDEAGDARSSEKALSDSAIARLRRFN